MRRLADRFVLEREVGSGGMARVFLGRDEVLDRPVAVKVLKPMHGDTEIGARFRREGRTAARLSHPNIVQVYDAGEAELDGREASYIVMEYLSGGDLKNLLDERGKLPGPDLARIGAEICSGLAHAHGRGVIHRDIKPHNILLDDHGRAKVSDFGIARALDTTYATRTGAYLGTALYSSPEQLQGHNVTFKSDVYSLGTTLYQAATGEPLFTGSPIEIASQHVSKPPPPMRERDPDLHLDEDLESLILACLSKEADDRPSAEQASSRFGSATTVPETVREEEPVVPVAAPPRPERPRAERPRPAPTMSSSGGRVPRRGRLPGVLAGVALLAVLGVIGLFALSNLNSGSGSAAQNNGPPNGQGNAGGSDGGGQGSQDEQANVGGGSNAGGGGGASQAEPTAASATASASAEPSPSDQAPAAEEGGSGGQAQDSSPEEAAAQTIRDFYETAASSDYQESWNYLSSGYQQEFGTRASLTNQFQTLERVEFTEGPTTTQLNGNTATVSASTIAHHSDRDDTLTGTADLVRAGDEWRISSLNFDTV